MASQPHDKSGKKCSRCPAVFTKASFTITLDKAVSGKNLIEKELVCGACHAAHYAIGE